MADDVKPPTQGERLSTLEEQLTELSSWGDETQAWIESEEENGTAYRTHVNERLDEFDNALRVLLDDKYGVNVRPAGFHHSTRIPDPNDADVVAARAADAAAPAASPEPATQDNARLDALESKLDRLLDALSSKD